MDGSRDVIFKTRFWEKGRRDGYDGGGGGCGDLVVFLLAANFSLSLHFTTLPRGNPDVGGCADDCCTATSSFLFFSSVPTSTMSTFGRKKPRKAVLSSSGGTSTC